MPVHPDPPNIYARTYARHSEIHAATMKGLEGQQALFDMIMEDAGEKGLDVEGEKTKGETYARNMLGEYFGKIMDEFKNIGPYTWEKNPIVVKFVEIWGKEFEKLSYTAQVAATLAFLNTNRVLTSNHPPYGTNEKLLPLLHGDIMEAYNILYNKAKTLKELDVKYKPDGKTVIIEKRSNILTEAFESYKVRYPKSLIKRLSWFKKKEC